MYNYITQLKLQIEYAIKFYSNVYRGAYFNQNILINAIMCYYFCWLQIQMITDQSAAKNSGNKKLYQSDIIVSAMRILNNLLNDSARFVINSLFELN